MYTRACLVALALTVAGCATMGGYQPTVDPYNDPYAGRIPHDEAECRELALQSSGGTAKESALAFCKRDYSRSRRSRYCLGRVCG